MSGVTSLWNRCALPALSPKQHAKAAAQTACYRGCTTYSICAHLPSIHLSIYLSFYPSIYPTTHLSVCQSLYLFTCLPVCLSIYLSIHPSTHPSIPLSPSPSPSPSLSLSPQCPPNRGGRRHLGASPFYKPSPIYTYICIYIYILLLLLLGIRYTHVWDDVKSPPMVG